MNNLNINIDLKKDTIKENLFKKVLFHTVSTYKHIYAIPQSLISVRELIYQDIVI